MKTLTGLERTLESKNIQNSLKGNIGLLSHSATITSDFKNGVVELKKIFGNKFIEIENKLITSLFGPKTKLINLTLICFYLKLLRLGG